MTPEKLIEQVEFFGSAKASYAVAHAANDPKAAANFANEGLTALLTVKAEIERQATELSRCAERLDLHAWDRLEAERDRLRAELDKAKAGGPLVALTMAPYAGHLFWAALSYAANRIPSNARVEGADDSHEDWLRWGASRLDAAIRAAEPSGETGHG